MTSALLGRRGPTVLEILLFFGECIKVNRLRVIYWHAARSLSFLLAEASFFLKARQHCKVLSNLIVEMSIELILLLRLAVA